MHLTPGQTVVHPRHGTATVIEYEQRDLAGTSLRYIVLRREEDSLTVRIPADQCEDHGIRQVMGREVADEVLQLLADDPTRSDASWRKRHSAHEKRLKSGDPREIAVIVRELTRREREDGISMSDRRLLDAARARLVGELSEGYARDEAHAEELVDGAVA